jgi:hypothetical protein
VITKLFSGPPNLGHIPILHYAGKKIFTSQKKFLFLQNIWRFGGRGEKNEKTRHPEDYGSLRIFQSEWLGRN